MSYLGENGLFSFRDGYCEVLPDKKLDTASAADFGRKVSVHFKRFAIGCGRENLCHIVYSLCAGIAECGKDVFLCENTEIPPFKYGFPLTGADCGIFVAENRIFFFGKRGFPVNSEKLTSVMAQQKAADSEKCGRIIHVSSFERIYLNSITDEPDKSGLPLSAGISCGNRGIRKLWHEIFSDEDDSLIFQISDTGERVNAYSTEHGFISFDRLILAYSIMNLKAGQDILWLPDKFHFAAERTAAEHGLLLKRFDADKEIPEEASEQRFLTDCLYMCAGLASDREKFFSILNSVPKITSAKRDIACPENCCVPLDKPVLEPEGRVFITRSGKNRLSLIAQAYDTETAAELCAQWNEKLRILSSCSRPERN